MKERKAKKKSEALALTPEKNLQALARKFKPLIEGIDRQIQYENGNLIGWPILDDSQAPEGLEELATADTEEAIALRDQAADLILAAEDSAADDRKWVKRIEQRARWKERLAEKFKFGLKLFMEMKGIREIQGYATRFVLHKNPASVFILDEQRIPEEYMNFKPVPDKEKIKEALLAGKEVPGCTLRADSSHLEIK